MKNISLLCAIICANQLYGMEPERSTSMQDLPKQAQRIILTYGDTLADTIKAIVRMSQVNTTFHKLVNDMYGNQKGFTELAYQLATKFNDTPSNIAMKFKTPIAKEYDNLTNRLEEAATHFQSEEVEKLIQQGADVNGREMLQLVIIHYGRRNFDNIYNMIKLLLEHGANPSTKHPFSGATALDRVEEFSEYYTAAEKEQLITLLKEAMQNYPQ